MRTRVRNRAGEGRAKTAARLAAAADEVASWRTRYGDSFRVSSGRTMCSRFIEMPGGALVHRSHLLFLRTHGMVSFTHLCHDSVVEIE